MRVFIGYTIFFLALLPAWAVKSAPMANRVLLWGLPVFLLGSFGAILSMLPTKQRDEVGPFTRRYGLYFGACMAGSLLLAELLSIALTHATPNTGILGAIGQSLSAVGEVLFPVVAGYRTSVEPALSPENLFRVQSITSTLLLGGLVSSIVLLVILIAQPVAERRTQAADGSVGMAIFGTIFVLYLCADAFFGWSDFHSRPASVGNKECLFNAACYANTDDLSIFFVAVMKVVAIFGFPLGALVGLRAFLSQSEVSHQDRTTQPSGTRLCPSPPLSSRA